MANTASASTIRNSTSHVTRWTPRRCQVRIGFSCRRLQRRSERRRPTFQSAYGAFARSGRPHPVTLLAISRRRAYVLTPVACGSPRRPDWYNNLVAHPDFRVGLDRVTKRFRARVALGDERRECWGLAVAVYPCYAAHLERARRTIPLLLLTPID